MHSFALALLSKPISLLKEKYPGISVNFKMANPDVIQKMLQSGSIDFGIVLNNDDFSGYDCEVIYEGHYQLYSSTVFSPEKVILSEQRKETNLLKDHYFKKFQEKIPVLMEVSSWEVITKLTEEGLGMGFFPDYIAKGKELKKIDLGLPLIPYQVFAIFPMSGKKHKNSEVFITLFREIYSGSF